MLHRVALRIEETEGVQSSQKYTMLGVEGGRCFIKWGRAFENGRSP